APALALDHLEVDADGVPCLEPGPVFPQMTLLEELDRLAHRKTARGPTGNRSGTQAYEMSSSSDPSGSRKYTLAPPPPAPDRGTGPSSTSTPCSARCATASSDRPRPHEA